MEKVALQGRAVLLQPLGEQHRAALRALAARFPQERAPYAHVPTPERFEAWFTTALQMPNALVFATCRPSGEVIGSTRLFDVLRWAWPAGLDPRPSHAGFDSCEIGYTWLMPEVWRSAVNTEAKYLMLRHAFEAWGCHRVQLKTDERNQRSRDAIARLGAKFEGILRANQPAMDGTLRNSAFFSILAAEWPAVREGLLRKMAD